MNERFSAFIFRTRGIYMFISLTASVVLKSYLGGITPLFFFVTSLTIAAIVQALRMYSASFLLGRQAVTTPQADFLATSGPYAYIRNPLYLGNFLIGLAVCLAINEWYAYALFVVSYIFVYSIVIPYEEKFLRDKFGDTFTQYMAQTGRLLPRFKGYRGDTRVIPDFRAGILGEIHAPIILGIMYAVIYLLFVR